jgi:hypothetical protein
LAFGTSTKLKLKVPQKFVAGNSSNAELLDQLSNRVRMRLGAADVQDFSVGQKRNLVEVTIYGDLSQSQAQGLVVPKGTMVVARAVELGDHWMRHSGQLPDTIEFRQPDGSLDPQEGYLWSKSYRELMNFIESESLESGMSVGLYPEKEGWQTIGYGKPIATESDLSDAEFRRTNDGAPYVRIDLKHAIEEPTTTLGRDFSKWVVVVDGEIVALSGSVSANAQSRLNLSPPDQISESEARTNWARQIAGRLKAPYPFEPELIP